MNIFADIIMIIQGILALFLLIIVGIGLYRIFTDT